MRNNAPCLAHTLSIYTILKVSAIEAWNAIINYVTQTLIQHEHEDTYNF